MIKKITPVLFKKSDYYIYFVIFCLALFTNTFAQTTETFDDETGGSSIFSDNGQDFNVTSETSEDYDIFEDGYNEGVTTDRCAGCGWNGSGIDQKFLDNTGGDNQNGSGNGSSVTISTDFGTDITVKSVYVFISTNSIGNPSTTLTIMGKKDGALVYTITKSSGFSNVTTFTPSNGFTLIDFASEGAADYSNTNVDEIVFTTTGNGDYIAIDAFTWDVQTLSTSNNALDVSFKVYPNPTSSMINISIPVKEVSIYNINGKQVLISNISTFSVKELSNGMYIMNIITDQGTTIKKFIKN